MEINDETKDSIKIDNNLSPNNPQAGEQHEAAVEVCDHVTPRTPLCEYSWLLTSDSEVLAADGAAAPAELSAEPLLVAAEPEPLTAPVGQPSVASEQRSEQPKSAFLTRKAAVWLLAGCLLFAGVLGFGGGFLAARGQMNNNLEQAQVNGVTEARPAAFDSLRNNTAMSVAEIATSAANSVVEITTEVAATSLFMEEYVMEGAGSGVIIRSDGYIVTNNHVIDGASKINVRTKDGKDYTARVIGSDSKTDLAILKIEAANLQAAVLGSSADLQVGELAVAIGNPLGELGGTVTDGIISALDREITVEGKKMNLLQTNAAINPGNSGGGLFNGQGQLIGIVSAKSSGSDVEGLGFAIPIDDAREVMNQLIEHGYVQGRVYLGVSLVEVNSLPTAMQYQVNQFGLYIAKVESGTAADKAGLKSGDLIFTLGDQQINKQADLDSALSKYKVGDSVQMTVLRGGEKKTVTVVLGEYKPSKTIL